MKNFKELEVWQKMSRSGGMGFDEAKKKKLAGFILTIKTAQYQLAISGLAMNMGW